MKSKILVMFYSKFIRTFWSKRLRSRWCKKTNKTPKNQSTS